MYPCLIIDLNKLRHNTRKLVELCRDNGIEVYGVTKCFCALYEAAYAIYQGGASALADSRIENLKKLKDIPIKKVLLRIPMDSEADEIVEYVDLSLNSEIKTLKALGKYAVMLNKVHNVIIMVDMGDLREGVLPLNLDEFLFEAKKIEGINIEGFGVNLTCYGGVIPDEKNLGDLVKLSREMAKKHNIDLKTISGGNSSSLYLLKEKRMIEGINNLRLGESILLGRETAFGEKIDGLYDDVFTLRAKIVELKDKPTHPIGNIGMDAFGNKPKFIDRGIRKRAILAVGRQDVKIESLYPIDRDLIILGGSSDHLILDITDSKFKYNVGDTIDFLLDYGSLLAASTSPYVKKILTGTVKLPSPLI